MSHRSKPAIERAGRSCPSGYYRAGESHLLAKGPTAASKRLADANVDLRKKQATLQSKVGTRAAALKRFQSNTVKRIARNIAVEVASLPERAVPILGVAAPVGTAAYGIHSDCEILRELNRLAEEHAAALTHENRVCVFIMPTTEEVWSGVKARTSDIDDEFYERPAGLF